MSKLTLVVMAAGMGSRFGGLKQVEPAGPNGEAVIDYSAYDARRAGFERVVFIIRRDIEADFRAGVGRRIGKGIEVDYAFQSLDDLPPGAAVPAGRVKPWGTAQAVLSCRDLVDGPFLVINADDFYGRASYRVLADFLRTAGSRPANEYALAGYALANTLSPNGHVTRAACRTTPDGYLSDIKEIFKIQGFPDGVKYTDNGSDWLPIPAETTVSMNFWGFMPGLFAELQARFPEFLRRSSGDPLKAEFLVPEVIGSLIREGRARVHILPTPEKWFGVTYPQDMPEVRAGIRKLIDQGIYPADLWA